MANSDVEVATILLQSVLIVLPFWLVAIRYIDKFLNPAHEEGRGLSGEGSTAVNRANYISFIFLTYISVVAVMIFSTSALDPLVTDDVKVALRGLEMFVLATGLMMFAPLKSAVESRAGKSLFTAMNIVLWFFLIGTFLRMVLSAS